MICYIVQFLQKNIVLFFAQDSITNSRSYHLAEPI